MGMLARHFWIGTACELLLYLYIVARGCRGECSVLGIVLEVAIIYLGVRLVLVAASFVVTGIVRAPRLQEARIGALSALWMYLEESLATLLTFCVLQPMESWLAVRNPPPGAGRSRFPILLVHGFLSNGGVWWGLRRRLIELGFSDVHTVNLEPITGDIDDLARALENRVDEILRDSPAEKLILIGHSMGGLVCRVFVAKLGGADRVRGIITLGTPHHGTVLARLLGGANVIQMRRGSRWLKELNAVEAGAPRAPLTSLYSHHDNIVAPQESSRLDWAENSPVAGVGHMALIYSPRCQAAVIQALQRLF